MANVNLLEKIRKIEKDISAVKQALEEEEALKAVRAYAKEKKAGKLKPWNLKEEMADKKDAETLKKALKRTSKEGWVDFDTLVKTYKKEGLI